MITKSIFYEFMSAVYLQKKRYKKRIQYLFNYLDPEKKKEVLLTNFFEITDIFENYPKYQPPMLPDNKIWDSVRKFLNQYLKLKKIAKSLPFEIFMFIVLIINCGIIIAMAVITDESKIEELSKIDDILLYFYIAECVIKIIGLGIEKYFEDPWNVFDLVMVVISLASDLFIKLVGILRTAKSLKATRLVRISKLNRGLKALKTLRTIKFFNFLSFGADIVANVKLLITRTLYCIPLIMRLIPIILLVFYIWAIIGMTYFNTKTFEH